MFRYPFVLMSGLLLLFASATPTLAQDNSGAAYCAQLSAEECSLLSGTAATMSEITSGVYPDVH